jgi:predicted nucleic acid-binding protein
VIVVDASILVRYLLRSAAEERLNALIAAQNRLAAPAFIDAEVLNALRRHALLKSLTAEAGRRAAETLRAIRMERFTLVDLLGRMWELRDNLMAYDAAYVALAEHLDVPLITRDARIAAAPHHRAQIRVI